MFDIAQIVLDDADKEGSASNLNLSNTSLNVSTSNVLLSSRRAVGRASPARGKGSVHARSYSADPVGRIGVSGRLNNSANSRSASPAMMESTLTAVQAALNRRQLQVMRLNQCCQCRSQDRSRVSLCEDMSNRK